MAMMQLFGAVARRATKMANRPSLASPISSLSSSSLPSPSSTVAPPPFPVLCGRGDKRTKKGKRFKGSYGNARPKKEKKIERIKDKVEVPRSTPWPLPFKLI
ncbi:30S ribosomal protein S31, mitochondrial [Rhodamnia argentea]|uniref:30S ribosomal protein S31, mitochondrial n=1 Tax=Rhodamnia argentea TaxID=178133 RepID=A0A8B8NLM7_9MYRT|nr:30S ribosomal protein S31, mitochondrial [Rhodamnia argentea]